MVHNIFPFEYIKNPTQRAFKLRKKTDLIGGGGGLRPSL